MLLLLSKHSTAQWTCWGAVRALSTHVVSAEVAQHVAQYGRGLVRLPSDMVQTLDGYFKDAGLTGRTAKLRSQALTDQLKALTRSHAKGGLQPYRTPDTGTPPAAAATAAAAAAAQAMTQQQLQEQAEMEAELEKMASAMGPEVLLQHRQARAAATAAAALPLPTTKSGRLKSSAKAALLDYIAAHGVLCVPHEYVRAALDLPPSSTLSNPERTLALKKVTPAYTASQVLGYGLSRLPGCYAASMRVFRELRVRLPGLKPKAMLDFGAGPGTASWAAQEVWPDSLSRVTAVEPSPAMRRLGERLEAARRFAHAQAPMVRWRSDLPPVPRSQRRQQQQPRYDLVVASYVLGEVPDPQERVALIRNLWGLTSDLLVLVEPGTPAGAANIQEARAALLQHEARRTAKLEKRLSAAAGVDADDAGTSSSSSGAQLNQQQQLIDPNITQKLSSKWFGAHVVAPCPHDGPCPLAAPGSNAWCHFGTRFQRPGFMQQAKAPKGARVNAADHQDERYAYVVIRRGSRPAATSEVDISRSFLAAATGSSSSGSNISHSLGRDSTLFAAAATAQAEQDSEADSYSGSDSEFVEVVQHDSIADYGSSSDEGSENEEEQLEFTEDQIQQQVQANRRQGMHALQQLQWEKQQREKQQQQQQVGAPSEAAEPEAAVAELFTRSELQQLSALLGADDPPAAAQQQQVVGAAAGQHYQRVNAKLDMFGEGLVNRLIALENDGVDWAAGETDSLSPQLAAQAAAQAAAGMQAAPAAVPTPHSDDTSSSSSSSGLQLADEAAERQAAIRQLRMMQQQQLEEQQQQLEDDDEEPQQGDQLHPYEVDMAAAASMSWSRIIRPPRKRGGHVILDVCAASSQPSAADGSQQVQGGAQPHGQLERHVVARSDSKKWMGRAAYLMAQGAQWGDLWPGFYNRNPKRQVLKH